MHVVHQPYGDEVPNATMRRVLSAAGLVAVIPFLVIFYAASTRITADSLDLLVIAPVALAVVLFPLAIAVLTPRRGKDIVSHARNDAHPISAPKWPYVMIGSLAVFAVVLAVIIYGGFAFLVNT